MLFRSFKQEFATSSPVLNNHKREKISSVVWNWGKLRIAIQLKSLVWVSALVYVFGRARWIIFRVALYLRKGAHTIN